MESICAESKFLNFNGAFEHELGRAGQCHIPKPLTILFKTNAEFTAAAHQHANWTADPLHCGEDQSTRHHSGPACECFVFHSAFIRANGNLLRSTFLQEI